MEDEFDRLVARVRIDTSGFARDVAAMRASLEGPLEGGADRAGRAIEASLLRAARSGRLGFEDLGKTALSVLGSIASAAVSGGVSAVLGGSGLTGVIGSLLGSPGRATGGPVSPGRAYMVGERGPEVFVPSSSGRVEAPVAGGPREVRVAIAVNAGREAAAPALAKSGRQVARAVKAALEGA